MYSKVLASAFAVVFLLLFIAMGIFFATSAREHGAPTMFSWVGWGFALLGVILLVGALTGIFRKAPPTPAGGSRPPDPVQLAGDQPGRVTRCPGCGAPLSGASCSYCGAG